MKITFLQIGKTHFPFVNQGVEEFTKRLKHYCKLESVVLELPSKLRSSDADKTKENEGEQILKRVMATDCVILLDEKGKSFTSREFGAFIEKTGMQKASIVFVIGGAFGFSDAVYKRADHQLSLSKMTFSHQLIRLIFMEQLYRAFTIIKGEQYHND